MLPLGKHLLEELNEDHSGVEVKEDGQGERHPLDDDPWHEAVEVSLHEVGPHLLDLEGYDQPLSEVEEK